MAPRGEEKLADKITRGSLVGKFHDQGVLSSRQANDEWKRPWSIKHLESSPPRKLREPQKISQTFAKSEEWFAHKADGKADARLPFFSPRYWREAMARSPGASFRPDPEPLRSGRRHVDPPGASSARPVSKTYGDSEAWMQCCGEPPASARGPAKTGDATCLPSRQVVGGHSRQVVNSIDYRHSAGKKTFTAKKPELSRRIMQDESQPIPEEKGRRHLTRPVTEQAVDHFEDGANVRGEVKYMAGSHVITSTLGRRPAVVPSRAAAAGQIQDTVRHQHNSDVVRQHLQPGTAGALKAAAPPPRVRAAGPPPDMRSAASASSHSTVDHAKSTPLLAVSPAQGDLRRADSGQGFSIYGNHSAMTSTLKKSSAFMQSHGVRSVQSLRPGLFSPLRRSGGVLLPVRVPSGSLSAR